MSSITIRHLSDETKARLREQASATGRSLEAYVRGLLDQAASASVAAPDTAFPHDLMALVEPGADIDPLIAGRDEVQAPINL
jgi:plasmid stability protein